MVMFFRLIVHHGPEGPHRGRHRRDRQKAGEDPAVHEHPHLGHPSMLPVQTSPRNKAYRPMMMNTASSEKEHRRFIPEKQLEIAFRHADHSRSSFPVTAMKASSIVPPVTSKLSISPRHASSTGRASKVEESGTTRRPPSCLKSNPRFRRMPAAVSKSRHTKDRGILRIGLPQLLRRPLRRDPAVVDNQDVVRPSRFLHIMGGQEDGHAGIPSATG